jgi:hypothetical protein
MARKAQSKAAADIVAQFSDSGDLLSSREDPLKESRWACTAKIRVNHRPSDAVSANKRWCQLERRADLCDAGPTTATTRGRAGAGGWTARGEPASGRVGGPGRLRSPRPARPMCREVAAGPPVTATRGAERRPGQGICAHLAQPPLALQGSWRPGLGPSRHPRFDSL